MLRSLLATLIVCLGFPALAADMAIKAPPRAAAVINDWTGGYVGIHGGWNLGSFSPFCGPSCGPTATEVNLDDNSPFVGGHVGYLYQGSGSALVIGPELGIQWLGFKSQAELVPAEGVTPAVLLQQKLDWLAYANLRVGLSPFQSTLIYVTGGVAWAHAKGQIINLAALDTSNTSSIIGWNIGGGLEFKFLQSVSLGFEYRHYDFGDVQAANPLFLVPASRLTMEQAMGRLNFRLN